MKKVFLVVMIALLSYAFMQSKNLLSISAGVAIFLFGMLSLEEGFRFFAGGMLEKFLKKLTNHISKSILFGAVTTTLMQSSGLVSVIAISFISAGLIGVAQGIGIVLGGNIGTTTGAWLIAGFGLKISIATYAMPMLVFGILFIFQNGRKLKGFETIDLSQYAVGGFKGILVFTLIGAIATIIMQSSHASLVLILTALAAGQITYENAIALTIGANIGTTITAVVGSLGASLDGKKLAGAHFAINTLTGLISIGLVPYFMDLIDITAPLLGIRNDDFALKLALYHTYFNFLCVALFTPLVNPMVSLLDRIFVAKKREESERDDVMFINDFALDFEDTAQSVLIKETKHLYANVLDIITQGLSIRKEDITSGMDIEDIIKLRHAPLHVDMDEFYEKRIKARQIFRRC